MNLIEKRNLQAHVHAGDWQQAISKAGQLLVASDEIKPSYIDRMISGVKELGPYIVLTPRFALAHSAPGDDVLQTSASLITLDEPIDFNSTKGPVDVVMALACRDKNSHMAYLQKIAEMLMRQDMLSRIERCRDADELYQLINGTEQERG